MSPAPDGPPPRIDAARLRARIDALATIVDPARPYGRIAFSDLHRAGRRWLAAEMEQLGLTAAVDAGGNLVGRREGREPGLPALATGSHSDTVPDGGRFDGAAGLLAGLEVVAALRDAGLALRHPLDIIDFLAEEPNRYGLSCIGSRAMAGALGREDLARRCPEGSSMAEGIAAMGGDPGRLTGPLRAPGALAGFVELHIEQGRVLEEAGCPVGVVTGIAGIRRVEVTLDGRADHSGATPMALRRDAGAGAAEIVLAVEAEALASPDPTLVATVGRLALVPDAANVVPGGARLTVEVRGLDDDAILSCLHAIRRRAQRVAARRRLGLGWAPAGSNAPAPLDPAIRRHVAEAARAAGLAARALPSGAGHDAAFMARLCPAGMIFVPSRDGRSHCPEEWTDPAAVVAGAQVLLDTLLLIDRALPPEPPGHPS